MKKLLLIAMLIPMTALAHDKITPLPPPVTESSSTSNANSHSDSSSSSDASGGASTLNQTIKSSKLAPAVFSSGTNNNVPCHGEWHAGASVLVGGVSYGRDRKDKDCLLKTAADDLYTRGNYRAAALLYCKIGYYAQALGKECVPLLSVAPDDQSISLDLSSYTTKDEAQAMVNAAFRSTVSK